MADLLLMIATGDFPGYAVMGFEEDAWQATVIFWLHEVLGF